MRALRPAAVAILAVALVAGAAPVEAAAPGRNGFIAFSKDYELWRAAPDGSHRRRLVKSASLVATQPAYSPDGGQIAFVDGLSRTRELLGADAIETPIYVARADGSRRRLLVADGSWPVWSPDGSRLAYVGHDGALRIVGADGRHSWTLVPGANHWAHGVGHADWAPDGRSLVFDRDGSLWIVHVSARVRAPREVLRPGDEMYASHPTWAPGGMRVAFLQLVRNDLSVGLLRVGVAAVRTLPGQGAPQWSPDGRWLAYDDGRGIFLLPSRGGTPERIVDVGGADDVFWDEHRVSWQPVCTLRGSARPDRVAGTRGDDLVCGLGGDDEIRGGAGRDRLFGEDGDDRFFARDGAFDVVGCGDGRDEVLADDEDLVGVDCERVRRAGR